MVKDELLETGRFSPSNDAMYRVYYNAPGRTTDYPVDIIPFGGVEVPPCSIAWPPDGNVIMNVVGYDETLQTALSVEIESGFRVPIASLPGLALLKLFAWEDRHESTPKNAEDLVVLCRRYYEAGNLDRIYGDEIALLEAVDFDLDLASPRLLGKDVRGIASATTLKFAKRLLKDQKKTDRLVIHMAAALKVADDNIDAAERILEQFGTGLIHDD